MPSFIFQPLTPNPRPDPDSDPDRHTKPSHDPPLFVACQEGHAEVDEARYSSFFKESTSLLLEESDTHHSSMEILEGFGRGFCDRSSERASHFAHPIAHLMARRSNSRYWGKSHEHLSTWGYQSLIGSMSQCPRQWPRVL